MNSTTKNNLTDGENHYLTTHFKSNLY